jgi:hypothetical protein
MALAVDTFSSANLAADSGGPSASATLYLNNTADIFVAQVALTSLGFDISNTSEQQPGFFCGAYIYEITLSNGEHLEFHTPFPTVIEWADAQNVTFVLACTGDSAASGSATATASLTTYTETAPSGSTTAIAPLTT